MANNKKKNNNKSTIKKDTKNNEIKREVKTSVTIKGKVEETPKKSSSLKTIAVLFVIIVVMVLGFVINKDDIKYEGIEVHNPEVDLEFSTFLENVENRDDGELVFLTLFMDTKIDATLYKAMILDEIMVEYNFPEYYIYYTNEMTKAENSQLTKFLGEEVNAYPMTFIIKNGKVMDYIWGYQVYDSYTEALIEKIENLDDYRINYTPSEEK